MSFRSTWSPTFDCLVRAGAQGIVCADISLAIWLKWDNTSANYEAIEINGSAGGTFAACIEIVSGNITFHITNAAGSSRITVTGPAYSAGVWTHAALSYDSTTLTGYVNGVSVGTATGLTGTRGNWTDLQIGPGAGELQDAFFYQRAISIGEVNALLRGRVPHNPQNLRHWLPLHPGANRLVDYSGNALNFTNSGTPVDGSTVPPVGWGAGKTRIILPPSGSAVAASGDGRTVFNGSGLPTVAVAAGGDGRTVFNGQGSGVVAIAAAGVGLTRLNGLATGAVAVAASGDGRTAFGGSGTPTVAIAAGGVGLTRFNGQGTGIPSGGGGGGGPSLALRQTRSYGRRHTLVHRTRRRVR